ncbi:hypothetical protein NLG97_g4691 [Lecanicillium saksenae]|uniref:Uncharacterized protein n=1 Tax=Lecanicillium saksenae TaxID=468837 RepID=A0ACC1QUS0_9HYPO|nr:hypothetical protein NLG97_g4691 [Lecanicillium saksenae]
MSSPHPAASPSPMSPASNRQTAPYETKPNGAGVLVHPPPTKQAHAHPTAYYVFDMLFKLAIAGAMIGLVAVQAMAVAESKAQTKQNKSAIGHLSNLASDLDSLRASVSSISDRMQAISSNILGIRNIMDRAR